MAPICGSIRWLSSVLAIVIVSGCVSPASAARHATLVIELGRNSSLRQSVTELEPGESVTWSNHGNVVHRVEIAGRRMIEVQPGDDAVTTFDHTGRWVALDPDLGEVVAVIDVANEP